MTRPTGPESRLIAAAYIASTVGMTPDDVLDELVGESDARVRHLADVLTFASLVSVSVEEADRLIHAIARDASPDDGRPFAPSDEAPVH